MFAFLTQLGSSRLLFQLLAAASSAKASAKASSAPSTKSLMADPLWIGSTLEHPMKLKGGIPGHEPPPKSVPAGSRLVVPCRASRCEVNPPSAVDPQQSPHSEFTSGFVPLTVTALELVITIQVRPDTFSSCTTMLCSSSFVCVQVIPGLSWGFKFSHCIALACHVGL